MKRISIRQRQAVKHTINAIASNIPLTKSEILQKSGYSRKVQRNPSRVFESIGLVTKSLKKLNQVLTLV